MPVGPTSLRRRQRRLRGQDQRRRHGARLLRLHRGRDNDSATASRWTLRQRLRTGLTIRRDDLPCQGGPRPDLRRGADAFVAKVNADGTALVYAGYIGGAERTRPGLRWTARATPMYREDRLRPDQLPRQGGAGPDLQLGGTTPSWPRSTRTARPSPTPATSAARARSGRAIAVDAAGNAYVTGTTESDQTTFPVKVGPDLIQRRQRRLRGQGEGRRHRPGLRRLHRRRERDEGFGIAVDTAGNAYVTGFTNSDETTSRSRAGPT